MCPRCGGYLVGSTTSLENFAVVTCVQCGFEGYGRDLQKPQPRLRVCRCGAHLGEGVPGPLCPHCHAVVRPRSCEQCAGDIRGLHEQARFCLTCVRHRSRLSQGRRRARVTGPRLCEDCKADIADRHQRAVVCVPCAKERDRALKRRQRAVASGRGITANLGRAI